MLRLLMLENKELIEEFKKSLATTLKSISKIDDIEISFTDENSSIEGKQVKLTSPSLTSLKNKLNYLRAEADAIALEFRLHNTEIHSKYLSSNELTNSIFNAVEQSRVEAEGSKIFKGVKNHLVGTRYHSLIIDNKTLSKDFIITAKTKDNVIMGIMHKKYNLHGVQFHPESISTKEGLKLIKNFLKFK